MIGFLLVRAWFQAAQAFAERSGCFEKPPMKKLFFCQAFAVFFPVALTDFAALSAGLALPAYAGQWEKKEEGISSWRYREDDGSYVVNSWKEIDGNWYYFDGTGCMVTGSYLINGRTERFDGQGVWIENPSEEAVISRYTVENDDGLGPGVSNWRQDDTGWYYQNFDGSFL